MSAKDPLTCMVTPTWLTWPGEENALTSPPVGAAAPPPAIACGTWNCMDSSVRPAFAAAVEIARISDGSLGVCGILRADGRHLALQLREVLELGLESRDLLLRGEVLLDDVLRLRLDVRGGRLLRRDEEEVPGPQHGDRRGRGARVPLRGCADGHVSCPSRRSGG